MANQNFSRSKPQRKFVCFYYLNENCPLSLKNKACSSMSNLPIVERDSTKSGIVFLLSFVCSNRRAKLFVFKLILNLAQNELSLLLFHVERIFIVLRLTGCQLFFCRMVRLTEIITDPLMVTRVPTICYCLFQLFIFDYLRSDKLPILYRVSKNVTVSKTELNRTPSKKRRVTFIKDQMKCKWSNILSFIDITKQLFSVSSEDAAVRHFSVTVSAILPSFLFFSFRVGCLCFHIMMQRPTHAKLKIVTHT